MHLRKALHEPIKKVYVEMVRVVVEEELKNRNRMEDI